METEGTVTAERMLREAEFRERRARLLRAEAMVGAAFVLGLAGVWAAKQVAPQAFELATAAFAIATLGALLRVWRVARRVWRCPACDVRWQTADTLASFQWNHCPSCGATLRAHPARRASEREALTAFRLEAPLPEVLSARFERQRRRGLWLAGAAAIAGLAVLVWTRERDLGEIVEQSLVAGFGAAVAGSLVWGMRCPRCRTGVVARGGSCQRCGLRLGEDGPGSTAPPR